MSCACGGDKEPMKFSWGNDQEGMDGHMCEDCLPDWVRRVLGSLRVTTEESKSA